MDSDVPSPADVEAIRGIVRDIQDGFNNNDAALMNAHMADDAVVVNARGAVLNGRRAIEKATEDSLAAGYLRDSTAYYELTDVIALATDVITARKNAWSTRENSQDGIPPEMNALYIFVRRANRWVVWRRQNTLIA
ncbi:hypothetical protein BJF84_07415 [Rhodococcus sp. CUA-806]|nr:hypothetical protein BJF84_07415 [Rhodococcus sp. CUA-806]